MNPEKFNPSNPEYKKVEDLPIEEQSKFKNEGEGFVEKGAIENKEASRIVASAIQDEINREMTKMMTERGTDTLELLEMDVYEGMRKEATQKAMERMMEENSELKALVDAVEKEFGEETDKVVNILKEKGADEETINNSRRGFLKMLGLGAAVATGVLGFSDKVEARPQQPVDDPEVAYLREKLRPLYAELRENESSIRTLSGLTDRDIEAVNRGEGYGGKELLGGPIEIENSSLKKRTLRGLKQLALFTGIGAAVGGGMGILGDLGSGRPRDLDGVKALTPMFTLVGGAVGTVSLIASMIGDSAPLDSFVARYNGKISREVVLGEVALLKEKNENLLKKIKEITEEVGK